MVPVSTPAARTDAGGTLTRPHGDFDTFLVHTEAGVLVDKTPEMVAAVQNRDQFHGEQAASKTSTITAQLLLL
jgi:hypothetical protein